jgi:hypothetical protein
MLLLCCTFLGGALGVVGWIFTGSQYAFLAVPAVVATAWFAVADPSQCVQAPEGKPAYERGSTQRQR